jgi:hypothetical protein
MQRLKNILQRIDGRGYGAYQDLQGQYQIRDWTLIIDHVQGDPYAPPSRLRLQVPLAVAGFPASYCTSAVRRVALGDYLTRLFHRVSRQPASRQQGSPTATIRIDVPGQEVLPRSSIAITDTHLEARCTVALPARGRTVLGYQAITLLCETLPAIADQSLRYRALSSRSTIWWHSWRMGHCCRAVLATTTARCTRHHWCTGSHHQVWLSTSISRMPDVYVARAYGAASRSSSGGAIISWQINATPGPHPWYLRPYPRRWPRVCGDGS